MRGVDAQIRAGGDGVDWKRRVKAKVRSPGFVDEQRHAVLVCDARDAHQVGGDAVVGGANDVDRFDVGLFVEGASHRFGRDGVVHVQSLVHLGLHVHRQHTAHDEPAHHALVRVTGNRDFLAGIRRSHQHDLIAARRAVDEEEREVGAVRLGRQALRFVDRSARLQQVVEPANLRQVDRQHVLPDELAECGIHAMALHVPRRVKRHDTGVNIVE